MRSRETANCLFCSIKILLKGCLEFLSSFLIGKRYNGSLSLPIAVFQIQDKCLIEKIKYLNGFSGLNILFNFIDCFPNSFRNK